MSAHDLALLELPIDTAWRRLNYTPLRDLVRGRVTARCDLSRETAALDLPPLAARLVYTVALRTKLWPREKREVARELAGHFRDGLDAGQSAEQLVERFGNLRQAVKLIRRARLRCRPLWWQVLDRAARTMLLLALGLVAWFLWNAAFFSLGRPTIARDFIAEINATAQTVPQEDRAWPFYRDAALALELRSKADQELYTGQPRYEPGDPIWQHMLDHLQAHQEPLRLVREGAQRPRLGFVYGDPADRDFMLKKALVDSSLPKPDECLIQLYPPYLFGVNLLPHVLDMDARRAAAEGDAAALRQDLRAMLSFANHIWESDSFLSGDFTSLYYYNMSMARIGRVLADRPELFTDADLRDLSHQISAYANGDIHLRLNGERMAMLDLIQRLYTDDGSGDGHLTAEGYRLLCSLRPYFSRGNNAHSPHWYEQRLFGGAACGLIAGRAEMTEVAMRLFDRAEAEQRGPLYQWKPSEVDAELKQMAGSTQQMIRFLPVALLFPDIQSVGFYGAQTCQGREAMLAALALELYHRRTGEWPKSLADLSPGLMPTIPLDRFTGDPLGYKLVDGRPLLYSRGADGQDDGGATPSGEDHGKSRAAENPHVGKPVPPGYDWLHWPPPPLPEPAKENAGRLP